MSRLTTAAILAIALATLFLVGWLAEWLAKRDTK